MKEGMVKRRAIVQEDYQYVVIRGRRGGQRGLYRRLDGSPARDVERLSRLRNDLLQWESELAKGPSEVRQDLDELERARLEALGYVVDEEP
jgi:hypothetical protein